MEFSYFTAFAIGLLGSTHCMGMCGGIATSIGLHTHSRHVKPWQLLLLFNLGRISSYAGAGALLGLSGELLFNQGFGVILRTLASLLLVAMGLYVGQWWFGIIKLEKLGMHLWKHIQPSTARFLPVRTRRQAILLGILWGWLPCGLVYSTLLWSSTSASTLQSSLLMFLFGLGTLPAMFLTGMLAKQINPYLQHRITRKAAGLVLIIFGFVSLPF